jgi:alpha-ketoglutarate-dependent taurine dioxygenase
MAISSWIERPQAEQLHHALAHGHCVVRHVGLDADNASLIALGKQLGTLSFQSHHKQLPSAENEGVYRVQVMDAPLHDSAGNIVLSSNADEFPLHTDDSYSPAPAHYVLMHCWQADAQGGGESWVAHVDAIVALAAADLIQRLASTPYPTPFGNASVLRHDAAGQWRVRFNCRDMMSFAQLRQQALSAQQTDDLLAFEQLAMQCMQRMQLAPGDCIVVDNHRVLHGRSAFDPASGRLLKRLRVLGD